MRKLLAFWLIIPIIGFSQAKTVLSANRVFPKVDKVAEFEKALTAHAQKYHTGDWKWRVLTIESGPDAGGYQLNEGPNSWGQIDNRGQLSAEHQNDWNKTVAIYLTERSSISYLVYQDSLSTVKLTDYADKIAVTRYFPKIGWGNKVREMIMKMKPVWEAGGESVAVYQASSSGAPQYAIVTRYKQGLKERDPGFRKSFQERYEVINGAGSWSDVLDVLRQYVADSSGELLFYRADLSSK